MDVCDSQFKHLTTIQYTDYPWCELVQRPASSNHSHRGAALYSWDEMDQKHALVFMVLCIYKNIAPDFFTTQWTFHPFSYRLAR